MNPLNTKIKNKESFGQQEMYEFQKELLEGNVTKQELIEVFQFFHKNPITTPQLLGVVEASRESMVSVETTRDTLDTAGTGGDGVGTFNISTVSAIICSAAGVPTVKHGNRSASGNCGSADVLEQLGLDIEMETSKAVEMLEKFNFTFFFAPKYHPSFKFAREARSEFGKRTYFNFTGPLINPARPKFQIIGVSDKAYIQTMGDTLIKSGSEKVWILNENKNGLDEIVPFSNTTVYEFSRTANIRKFEIVPQELEIAQGKLDDLRGGIKEINAAIFRNVLRGKSNPAQRMSVILNAAAGLVVFGKVEDMKKGIVMAKETIDNGSAIELLEKVIEFSKS